MAPTKKTKAQPKIARLSLTHIGFVPAVKISFLVSLIVAVFTILLTIIGWVYLSGSPLMKTVSSTVASVSPDGHSPLLTEFSLGNVILFALVVALLQIIVISVLGGLFSVLYNFAAVVTGGWSLKFVND